MEFSENALDVLNHRYLHNGETPEEMLHRVAGAVGGIKKFYKGRDKDMAIARFYRLLDNNLFWPNTPCLINADKPLGQLAACFVFDIKDSIEDIFGTLKNAAIVQKTGGGTGFSFSSLRPKDFGVDSTQGTSSGPVSFMKVYNSATNEMKQGGVRRGANMAVLRVDHPDIFEFITCKDNEGDFANFNISIGITDDFMRAVYSQSDFALTWKGKVVREVPALKIWLAIISQMWKNGEPGLIFIDRINSENPLNEVEKIYGVNPCGEQPLPNNGVCNLGSINLSTHVKDWTLDVPGVIDWADLKRTVRDSVEFLDNVIEINKYPIFAIKKEAMKKRRIGLGIMGLADMFLKMHVRYGSTESFELADKVMRFIQKEGRKASIDLGTKREVPKKLRKITDKNISRSRNGCITTIAPTGSVSILADCSSGCEPIFAFDYDKVCIEAELNVRHWFIDAWVSRKGDEKLPHYVVEAGQVPLLDHIRMQGTLQQSVCSAISKTLNCVEATTQAEIGEALNLAFDEGCKSITLYRDGSRKYQALTKVSEGTAVSQESDEVRVAKSRPSVLKGQTVKIKTGRGKLYLTVNEKDGEPFEVFLKIGKSGREDYAYSEAIGRLISLGLRANIPIDTIVRHLDGISGSESCFDYGRLMKSVPDAVAYFLRSEYLEVEKGEKEVVYSGLHCPDCETQLRIEENCVKCGNCGWSKCS